MNILERIKIWENSQENYEYSFVNNPYLIAEIGVNHESSLDTAKQLCLEAKKSGANA